MTCSNAASAINNNDRNENIMAEINEVAVGLASAKLRMPMMSVLCKFADHEDLSVKTAESAIVSGVLCEYHLQVNSPASPWAKFHSNLHGPEIGVLWNCVQPMGSKKLC